MTITTIQYKSLDDAYKYFNQKLFDGKLPDVILTLHRKAKTYGYCWHEKFEGRETKEKITEIALNPDTFNDRTDMEILSTMVHEMCHVYQNGFGDPSRKGYHNREFALIMKDIGLYPSSTGEPGGKETGQRMSHYIVDGEKFEIVAGAFLLNGNKLFWNSIPNTTNSKDGKKNKTREKYVCPKCHLNVWAKKDVNIACGDCKENLIIEEDD
jgi:predicted SprT family Zn-dependent metalloprotease